MSDSVIFYNDKVSFTDDDLVAFGCPASEEVRECCNCCVGDLDMVGHYLSIEIDGTGTAADGVWCFPASCASSFGKNCTTSLVQGQFYYCSGHLVAANRCRLSVRFACLGPSTVISAYYIYDHDLDSETTCADMFSYVFTDPEQYFGALPEGTTVTILGLSDECPEGSNTCGEDLDPNDGGADCTGCTDAGTPEQVIAFVLAPGDCEPLSGWYVLEQNGANPCLWTYNGDPVIDEVSTVITVELKHDETGVYLDIHVQTGYGTLIYRRTLGVGWGSVPCLANEMGNFSGDGTLYPADQAPLSCEVTETSGVRIGIQIWDYLWDPDFYHGPFGP